MLILIGVIVRKLVSIFLYPVACLLAICVLTLLYIGPWLIWQWLVQHTLVFWILFWSVAAWVALLLFLIVLNLILKWFSGEDRLHKIIRLFLWLAASFVAFCFVGVSGFLFRKINHWLIWHTPVWCEDLFNALDTVFGWLVLFVGIVIAIVLGQTWTAWYNGWCNEKRDHTLGYWQSHKKQTEREGRERRQA